MKKILLSAAVMVGLGMAASVAAAADGTITFTGQISNVTCTIDGNGTGATDFTVTLPEVQASALANAGTFTGSTPYNITVGAPGQAGCTNGTPVSIAYEAASPDIDATTGNLMNTGAATGVQIQLLNGDRSVINLATNPVSKQVTIANNTAVLPFFAQYIADGGAVVGGTVQSAVEYSVSYN
ncbi:type 1 fimbrial protein [Dyella jejuensis]|uniref:Type 1 fimbrial protein n=1 Tax=Dyella jejuensis TaxID=1432009 RepID=A0ABW8JK13_9GAMM